MSHLKTDAALRKFVLNEAGIRDSFQMWWAATSLRCLISEWGRQSPQYEAMKRALGKNPHAIDLVRTGLGMMGPLETSAKNNKGR